MWLLTQFFEIALVVAGLNFLWDLLKAPSVWLEKRRVSHIPPTDYSALQQLAREDYAQKIRASIAERSSGQQVAG